MSDEKIMLSRKTKMVSMDEADKTTIDKPIIGTCALATCFGVLIYDEENKEAAVAHLSTNWQPTIVKLIGLLDYEKNHVYQYKIIPGYYSEKEDNYQILPELKRFFETLNSKDIEFVPFGSIPKTAVKLDKKTLSYEFAFDAENGQFVTDQVLFGAEYNQATKEGKTK